MTASQHRNALTRNAPVRNAPTRNAWVRIASITLLTTPVTLALTACTTHDQPLPKEVTTALETAFNKGDIEGCTDLYTDDAEIISKFTEDRARSLRHQQLLQGSVRPRNHVRHRLRR